MDVDDPNADNIKMIILDGVVIALLDLDYVICHMVSRLTNLVMSRSQGLI
jgi:hypothetical protein